MTQLPIISQKIEALIQEYTQSLKVYNEAQFLFKQSEEIWSLGQMYEHIIQTNQTFARVVNYCLKGEKGQIGGEKTPSGLNVYSYGSFPPIKVKIPVKSLDTQPLVKSQAEYEILLAQNLTQAQELLPLAQANAREYKIHHVIFGFLNAAEWFQMMEIHMRHHLRQKTELEAYWAERA
ncbi:MAG: DinB family protein [Microscillaceae bacterium]|nr:DinB family protein [Microscillaceae bacterium]